MLTPTPEIIIIADNFNLIFNKFLIIFNLFFVFGSLFNSSHRFQAVLAFQDLQRFIFWVLSLPSGKSHTLWRIISALLLIPSQHSPFSEFPSFSINKRRRYEWYTFVVISYISYLRSWHSFLAVYIFDPLNLLLISFNYFFRSSNFLFISKFL